MLTDLSNKRFAVRLWHGIPGFNLFFGVDTRLKCSKKFRRFFQFLNRSRTVVVVD